HRGPNGLAPDYAATLSELDPLDFARVSASEGEPDLPWMLAAETLSAAVSPARAYHLDHHAYAMIGDPETEVVTLTALVVPRVHRRKGWGNRIMQALYAAFAKQSLAIPATVPEDLAPAFFTRCGWRLQDTSQLEMGLELSQRLEGGTDD
ncbi:MAG TPA: GNAT family N-acetyltransferase, partial [Rubrobacter sp.]|nr:GNAT family N-acetyltransferase [Rubrobacter sp.]